MRSSVAFLLLLIALGKAEDNQSKVNPDQIEAESTVSKIVKKADPALSEAVPALSEVPVPKKADPSKSEAVPTTQKSTPSPTKSIAALNDAVPALSEAVPVPNKADPSKSEAVPTSQKSTPSSAKPIATLHDAVPPPVATEDDENAQGKTRKSSLKVIQTQSQDSTADENEKPSGKVGTTTSVGDDDKQNDVGGRHNVIPAASYGREEPAINSQEKEERADQDIKKDEEKENKVAGEMLTPSTLSTSGTDKGAGDVPTPTISNAKKGEGDAPTATNSGIDNGTGDTTPTTIGGPDNQKDKETNPEKTELYIEKIPELKILKNEFAYASSEETKTLKRTIIDETGKKGEVWDISLKCRDCLCYFATDCDMERKCETPRSIFGLGEGFEKGDCGPFHISFPFWCDANNIQMDIGDAKMENDWRLCSLDLLCTTETIQKYFHKYPRDCNGDGKVDCLDYAAIHTLGPYGCLDKVKLNYWNRVRRKSMLQCMVSKENGPYAKKMLELQDKLKVQDFAAWKLEDIEKRKNSASLESTTGNPKSVEGVEKVEGNEETPVEYAEDTKTSPEKAEESHASSAANPGNPVKNPEKDVENHGNAEDNSSESDSEENNSSKEREAIQT